MILIVLKKGYLLIELIELIELLINVLVWNSLIYFSYFDTIYYWEDLKVENETKHTHLLIYSRNCLKDNRTVLKIGFQLISILIFVS